MKKFLSVLVALVLCVSLCAPALAADTASSLTDMLSGSGIDLGSLSEADLTDIIGQLGLEGVDVDAILGGDSDALADLEGALKDIEGSVAGGDAAGSVGDAVTNAAGDIDLSWLESIMGSEMDTSAITDMLGGLDTGSLDSLLGTVSDALGGAGIDLESFDLGSFDIASILGGITGGSDGSDGSSSGSGAATDAMAGIMDTLMGGLEALGLDTTLIEGMLDNDIVNFFANMYIGFIGKVDEEETTEEPTELTTKPTTTKPAVVTTTTPKTGDNSAVLAACAVISVAAVAAFVCLKKKKD